MAFRACSSLPCRCTKSPVLSVKTLPSTRNSTHPSIHCAVISPGTLCSGISLPANNTIRINSSCVAFNKVCVVQVCKSTPSGRALMTSPDEKCFSAMVLDACCLYNLSAMNSLRYCANHVAASVRLRTLRLICLPQIFRAFTSVLCHSGCKYCSSSYDICSIYKYLTSRYYACVALQTPQLMH